MYYFNFCWYGMEFEIAYHNQPDSDNPHWTDVDFPKNGTVGEVVQDMYSANGLKQVKSLFELDIDLLTEQAKETIRQDAFEWLMDNMGVLYDAD